MILQIAAFWGTSDQFQKSCCFMAAIDQVPDQALVTPVSTPFCVSTGIGPERFRGRDQPLQRYSSLYRSGDATFPESICSAHTCANALTKGRTHLGFPSSSKILFVSASSLLHELVSWRSSFSGQSG